MKDIVVKPNSPYYIEVLSTIRKYKKKLGKWSEKDEQRYKTAKQQKTAAGIDKTYVKRDGKIKLSIPQFKTLEDISEKDSYLMMFRSKIKGDLPHYELNNYTGARYRIDTVNVLVKTGLAKIVGDGKNERVYITKLGKKYLEQELESRCRKP